MLPISIVSQPAWIEYERYKYPCYKVPTRETLKRTGLVKMFNDVNQKVKDILNDLEFVNTSVDGWSDATNRCFNGYIAQGIDSNWNLISLPIAFEFVEGN